MTSGKNYNSIVFLTTLSVYLGLVLVGGTPPVLAHAALTQHFDIQNELEVKDELDKKPDDECTKDAEIISKFRIVEAITNFVSDLNKLESIGRFNSKEDWNFSHRLWSEHFDATYSVSKNSDVHNPWLETAIGELILTAEPENLDLVSDFLPNCNSRNCRETIVKVETNANEFSLSFTLTKSTPEKAKSAAEAFDKIFVSKKAVPKNAANLKIYENTKISSENNQVFIVTRLPRGSLNALLADKDAR